jgi:hypothetical protein
MAWKGSHASGSPFQFVSKIKQMEVSFVRTQGAPDRIYVRRTAGGEVSWSFPTYGAELPHDLVHLVVEAAFDLRDGIWAAVDAGLDLARANAQANRKGGARKYAGTGLDRPSVYLSEALAGAGWGQAGASDGERRSAIQSNGALLRVEIPASVTLERIAQVREKLDQLRERWRTLVPKGAIVLPFDPADPPASFRRY